jgi:anti-sigma regulatory factor (Ser/Thr protein kinase)
MSGGGPVLARFQFARDASSVADARHVVRGLLIDAPLDIAEAVEVMVSELATNCLVHTTSPFTMRVDLTDEEIRVDVTDGGDRSAEITPRAPEPDDPTGRGLMIIAGLSDAWGVRPEAVGTTVWFRLSLRDPGR